MTSEYRIRITDRDLERFEKMAEWERELRSGFVSSPVSMKRERPCRTGCSCCLYSSS